MQLVIALLAVILGVLFAFGGWRFFLILLPFWGLFMGFNIGTEATRALLGDGTFATLTSWAIGIILARSGRLRLRIRLRRRGFVEIVPATA